LAEVEIVARVERRRKWTEAEKAALLAEVEAEGGKVSLVARRHRVAESLLYNWRSVCKAAAAARCGSEPLAFVPVGIVGRDDDGPALLAVPQAARSERVERRVPRERVGMIELDLPGGARLRVDAFVNEKALRRVLQALTPHRRAARYTWLEAESSSWNRCPELMAAVIAGADLAGAAPGKGFSFCSGRPIKRVSKGAR